MCMCMGILKPQQQILQAEICVTAGQMPREISVAWSSTLVSRAWLSQQWSGACLSYFMKVVNSTLLGLLINVLASLEANEEFIWEPIYGWSLSADMAGLTMCADTLGMSPCQMCLV